MHLEPAARRRRMRSWEAAAKAIRDRRRRRAPWTSPRSRGAVDALRARVAEAQDRDARADLRRGGGGRRASYDRRPRPPRRGARRAARRGTRRPPRRPPRRRRGAPPAARARAACARRPRACSAADPSSEVERRRLPCQLSDVIVAPSPWMPSGGVAGAPLSACHNWTALAPRRAVADERGPPTAIALSARADADGPAIAPAQRAREAPSARRAQAHAAVAAR